MLCGMCCCTASICGCHCGCHLCATLSNYANLVLHAGDLCCMLLSCSSSFRQASTPAPAATACLMQLLAPSTQTDSERSRPDTLSLLSCLQVLTSLRHLHASTQKLVHLLVSQACLQQHAPPEVSKPPWAGKSTPPFSPAGRGELLMAAVMALAQPSHYTQGPATLLNTLLSGFALAVAAQSAISKVSSFPFLQSLLDAAHLEISKGRILNRTLNPKY